MYLQLCRAQVAAQQPTLTQAPCDRAGRWPGEASASCEPVMAFPALRIAEDHAYIRVITELPGMDPDELEISIDGATLTLRAYPRTEERSGTSGARSIGGIDGVPCKRHDCFRVGRGFESFLCRVQLPGDVDCTRGEAHLDEGVLFLTLPRLAPEPARTVTLHESATSRPDSD
ncbi:MAG: Hsp20/alpha crystallin family protein [Nannocystis sp.]|nr:Hsp20/alpha crystallin family protein [Nannocystis sp.]MBA3544849.1 Hsp20/alpha crystallin family protein [Nannocystis sp.]